MSRLIAIAERKTATIITLPAFLHDSRRVAWVRKLRNSTAFPLTVRILLPKVSDNVDNHLIFSQDTQAC